METMNSGNESESNIFKLEWYYIDVIEKQPKGPISIRDIDVFMRTNQVDSNTYVWKEGMDDWKRIYQIDDLKDIANITHTEIQESLIKTKIQSSFNAHGQKIENSAIDNFYFGSDGFWHIYNPVSKTWILEETKPTLRRKSFEYNELIEEEKEKSNNCDQDINEITIVTKDEVEAQQKIEKNNEVRVDDIIVEEDKSTNNKVNENIINITSENNIKFENSGTSKFQEKFINKKRKFGENIEKLLNEEDLKKLEKKKKKKDKKKEKKKKEWYVPKVNSNIYINGLPNDITEKEILDFFSRCGFIRKDEKTGGYKIKIYKDNNTGKSKGDALVSFLREESVVMAIDLFNETEIRPGFAITVDKAKFEQKGNYQARETYKLDHIQKFKNKTDIDRMLGWNEEDEEKGLKIVILKNMFEPQEFFTDDGLRQDIELDLIEECESNFGIIDKFKIYEEHPEGIVKIKFKNPKSAENCVSGLNNRYYNGKLVEAFYWDGKTDYNKFQEDTDSQDKRIDEFGKWLEN